MARGTNDAPTDVTPESETSNQATPMADAPANPTDAQQAEAKNQGDTNDPQAVSVNDDGPSEEALAQVRKDAEVRAQNPNKAVIREANEAVGGESFAYLQNRR